MVQNIQNSDVNTGYVRRKLISMVYITLNIDPNSVGQSILTLINKFQEIYVIIKVTSIVVIF